MRLAHPDQNNGVQILRRGYNFTDGSDGFGHLDAYVADPAAYRHPPRDAPMFLDDAGLFLDAAD